MTLAPGWTCSKTLLCSASVSSPPKSVLTSTSFASGPLWPSRRPTCACPTTCSAAADFCRRIATKLGVEVLKTFWIVTDAAAKRCHAIQHNLLICDTHHTWKSEWEVDTYWRARLSTVGLLICFITKLNNIFSIKMSRSKLVSTRRSTVLRVFQFSIMGIEWYYD